MFCPNCHKEIPDNAVFCSGCGTRIAMSDTNGVNQQPPQQATQQSVQITQPIPQQAAQQSVQITQQIPNQFSQQAANQFNAQPQQQQFSGQQQFNGAIPQGVPMYNPQYAAPMDNAPAAAKKGFNIGALLKNRVVWICLAAVIILAIAIIIIANMAASAGNAGLKGTQIKDPLTIINTSDGIYFYRADKQIGKIDSSYSKRVYTSSGKGDAIIGNDKVLYLISGDKISEVDQDVNEVYINFDGNTLVYYNTDDELWYYNGGSKEKIADIDVENYQELSAVRISPNGDTVVYTIYKDGENTIYIYDGSKSEELSTKATPVCVSNSGSIIYALNDNGKLGYFKDKKGDDFVSVKTADGYYTFSEDNKSLLFKSNGNTYYYDTSLEEAVKVCSGWVSIVLPDKTTGRLSSFDNFLGQEGGSIYRFERKGDEYEKIKLISSTSQYQVSPDGSSIIYLNKNKLYKVDTKTGENENEFAEISDEYMDGFIAVPDFSGFYLVDNSDNIYYVGKNGGTVKKPFAEDVDGAILDDSGVIVYLIDYSGGTGTLYYSSRGDKGKRVEGIGECSQDIYAESFQHNSPSDLVGFTIYAYNEDDVLYISTNGKDYKKTKVER